MHNKRRSARPVINGLAWTAVGSVRRARDTLPYSTRLLTYLLSEQSGIHEHFLFGQWLGTLADDDLLHLCETAIQVAQPVESREEVEARADMLMVAEVALFEELHGETEIDVTPEGLVPLVRDVGLCAGLEYFRRKKWIALHAISIKVQLVQAMLTAAGERARYELFDGALLEVFNWIEALPVERQSLGH